jgi:hypothetical protein
MPLHDWTHVAATYDSAQSQQLNYVNAMALGNPVGCGDDPHPPNASEYHFKIGAMGRCGSSCGALCAESTCTDENAHGLFRRGRWSHSARSFPEHIVALHIN